MMLQEHVAADLSNKLQWQKMSMHGQQKRETKAVDLWNM